MSLLRYLCFLLVIASLTTGCVRRRLTVRSSPPGALVYIDDQEIGRTPVSTAFTYYGTRKFRLVKDGYETIVVHQKFSAPWYQIPPLDFATENLWSQEIRDERVVEFELVPQANVSVHDVLAKADQLRSAAQPMFSATSAPSDRWSQPDVNPPLGGPWTMP